MGFLDELYHHAKHRITNDVTHPMDGLHDLADFAYNASGAHDVVDAAEDPTDWRKDLKAGAILGGYILPGMLAGKTIGSLAAGTVAKFAVPAAPSIAEIAADPASPEGYVSAMMSAIPGMYPEKVLGPLDRGIAREAGPQKQAAMMAALMMALSNHRR